jgi:hypothetical protein
VHQHRHTLARQQQRQQRRQVGHLAGAVIRRNHHRRKLARRRVERFEGRLGRIKKAGNLLHRLALDAHRQQNPAQFQVGNAAIQHRLVQIVGVVLGHAAGAVFAAADFFNETRGWERFICGHDASLNHPPAFRLHYLVPKMKT